MTKQKNRCIRVDDLTWSRWTELAYESRVSLNKLIRLAMNDYGVKEVGVGMSYPEETPCISPISPSTPTERISRISIESAELDGLVLSLFWSDGIERGVETFTPAKGAKDRLADLVNQVHEWCLENGVAADSRGLVTKAAKEAGW